MRNIFFKIAIFLFFSQSITFGQEKIFPNDDKAVLVNETVVNSENFEFSPAFYENGIVFISTDKSNATKHKKDEKFKNNNAVSIQIARRNAEGVLTQPELFSKNLTTNYNDGPLSFDRENKTIFYSTNNVKNGKKIKSKNNLVCQRIFMRTLANGEWQNPIDLPFNSDEFSNCHPSLSVDGDVLYFASNRAGGVGGMDIYMVKKEGDNWGNPINMGPEVNTPQNDIFPFIHASGVLFFATDGRAGLGGLDIYHTKPHSEVGYEVPQNLGKPFNSEADDFGFIADAEGKNGYLSSNRKDGKGEDDIFSFHTPNEVGKVKVKDENCQIIVNTVESAESRDIEGAKIVVTNITDFESLQPLYNDAGELVKLTSQDTVNVLTSADKLEKQTFTTNDEGRANLSLKKGKYLLNISKNGYLDKQKLIDGCEGKDEELVKMEKQGDNTIPIAGVLKNNRGLPIANAMVTLTDEKTNETQSVTTDNQGNYKFLVKPNADFKVLVVKDNFLATSTRISTQNMKKDAPTIPIKVEMAEINSPLPTGKVFQLNNVYYNYNDATLRPDARLDLDPLVSLLKAYPEVEIELSSHTDARGAATYNQNLSQRRAESAVKYLTDRGIANRRISAVGYGETQLRNRCADGTPCDETEHRINRRTEVKVTKGGDDLDISVVDKLYTGGGVQSNTAANNAPKTNDNPSSATSSTMNVVDNATPSSGEFWIVAGSYQDARNAENQAIALGRKGYVPVVIYASDVKFYRILVEKTNSLEVAKTLLKKLKSQREPAFVLRG
jgi:outer membrane protein OmpA-like peptidoglycan-associated protein